VTAPAKSKGSLELEEVIRLRASPEGRAVSDAWKAFEAKFRAFADAHPLEVYFWQIDGKGELWVDVRQTPAEGDEECDD